MIPFSQTITEAYPFPIPSAPCQVVTIPANPQGVRQARRQLRTAAYCRVSTDDEEQLTSYQNQLQYFQEKIFSNPDWSMVKVFADEGISGTQAKKRPEFLKMLDWCRQGRIDQILIKSISRFARNTVDSLSVIRELRELGIAVIFEKEGINTLEIDSEMLLTLLSCFAQAESESISGNVRWGMAQRFKSGKVVYNYANWYGYRRGGEGVPEIVPEEGLVVLQIFRAYRDGASLDEIRAQLERQGIPARKGGSWTKEALRRLLKNEKYCGDALLQKTYVENCISKTIRRNQGERTMYLVKNCHPPVIERALFEQVQAELARRAGKRKTAEKTKTELGKYSAKYALTELLYCGECGTPYRRCTWDVHGKRKVVWRCLNRLEHGTRYCKHSPSIEEERLHEAILGAIRSFQEDGRARELLREALTSALAEGKEAFNPCTPYTAEERLRELRERLMSLLEQAADGGVRDQEEFSAISDEMVELQQKLEASEDSGRDSLEQELDGFCELAEGAHVTGGYDDRLARKLLDGVKVLNGDRLLVTFKGGVALEQEIPKK